MPMESDMGPGVTPEHDRSPRPARGGSRILVVEDDVATRQFLVLCLRRAGFEVSAVGDVPAALEQLATRSSWDVLLIDIGLPGQSGFELVREAKRRYPAVATALMTADARLDVAIEALRSEVDDFLTKPVAPAVLVDQIERLLVRRASRDRGRAERVLAIGAHPDDVEIGVGGTLLRHAEAEDDIAVLTLTCGARGGDRGQRAEEAARAAGLLHAALYLRDLEDTRVPVADPTVGMIEEVIADFRPTVVYTHTSRDLHQDHRSVHQASMVAARRVATVYCYESPSATVEFHPARFVGIDQYLDMKLKVLQAYRSQVDQRPYLAEELVRATARYWGRFGGSRFCEPLEVVRDRAGALGGAPPLVAAAQEASAAQPV